MRLLTAFLGTIMLAHPSAALAQQFDLYCKGTEVIRDAGGEQTTAYSHHYRLDLDRGIWCEDQCEFGQKIIYADLTYILLQSEDMKSDTQNTIVGNTIDRVDGKHTFIIGIETPNITNSTVAITGTGYCEKSSFSGFNFPQTKF